jgi:Flp pilus assembly protein TadG
MINKTTRLRTTDRRGAIIVLFAFLLPILLVILGFSVDYAYMQKARNEARVISDLGAKAAADTLARTGGDVAAARASARLIASSNTVSGKPLTLNDDQIIFGRAVQEPNGSYTITDGQTPFNSVTVVAKRSQDSADGPSKSFFGQLYGRPTFDTIQQSSASYRDAEIILVLDRSVSMKFNIAGKIDEAEEDRRACLAPLEQSRWVALENAVKSFLRELEATQVEERIGLVTFASEHTRTCGGEDVTSEVVTLNTPLGTDLSAIEAQMDQLRQDIWFGATNITEGIREAREHFIANGSQGIEKFIVCLTDGVHTDGDGPTPEAVAAAQAGIKIIAITFSDSAGQEEMQELAAITNGQHYHANDEEELRQVFQRLAATFAILTK